MALTADTLTKRSEQALQQEWGRDTFMHMDKERGKRKEEAFGGSGDKLENKRRVKVNQ